MMFSRISIRDFESARAEWKFIAWWMKWMRAWEVIGGSYSELSRLEQALWSSR